MTRTNLIALMAVVWLATPVAVFAEAAAGQAGGTDRRGAGRSYNPATETTLTGTVENVQETSARGRGRGGLHLTLRTDSGTSDVRLGPAAYVRSKDFQLTKGDSITVTGSKITLDQQEVIVAREVKKGDKALTLRDAQGRPLWSRRGGRSSSH